MLKLSISTDGRREAPWAAMPVVVMTSSVNSAPPRRVWRMLINPRGNARFLARLRGTKVPGRLVDLLEDAVASLAGGLRFAFGARPRRRNLLVRSSRQWQAIGDSLALSSEPS
jgi:hypothetical protein